MVLLDGQTGIADYGAAGLRRLFFFLLFFRFFGSWFLHDGGWTLGRGRHRRKKYPPV